MSKFSGFQRPKPAVQKLHGTSLTFRSVRTSKQTLTNNFWAFYFSFRNYKALKSDNKPDLTETFHNLSILSEQF